MRYVLIDRITELVAGQRARAVKNVTMSDALMMRYRPDLTALPATMVLEAMAQTAGALAVVSNDFQQQPVLAKVQAARFHGQARAGDQIVIEAELEELRPEGCRVQATAEINGLLLAEATIYLAFVKPESMTEADCARLRAHFADLLAEWFGAQEARELVA